MHKDMGVLIVDDSLIIREKLLQMMEEIEHVTGVYQAQDFDSAMHEVKTKRPYVVLLDINIPGRNGIEILKEIKNFNKGIKVIMVSNVASEYYQKICVFLGADHFVDKYHDFENIPELIRKMNNQMRLRPLQNLN